MERAVDRDTRERRRNQIANVAICAGLALITLLVFAQTSRFEFLNFDDDLFISNNPRLVDGLTVRGLVYAFTANLTHHEPGVEYWEPLTVLTRVADAQFYGMAAGGHHITSVLIHLAAGLVLFGAANALLKSKAQSAVVAALFLIHPLHVEPVVWLSARKDILNGLFYVATVWAYAQYAARPNWRRYLLVCVAFMCANMAKPMAVSLPFVLLLLDFWPLRRFRAPFRSRETLRIVAEKLPLLVIAAAVALLAIVDQRAHGAVGDEALYPFTVRVGNAAISFCTYLAQTFVPRGLAILYPHPGTAINWTTAAAAMLFCVTVTVFVFAKARTRPWLFVGWSWFVVVLLPVSGLVQIGEMARADRYTYVALVGIFIAVVREVSEWVGNRRSFVLSTVAAIISAALTVDAWAQTRTWHDSVSAFRHAIAVTGDNYIAEANLGAALAERGEKEEGARHFNRALQLNAPALDYHRQAAVAAEQQGQLESATYHYSKILTLVPWDVATHERLGGVLLRSREYAKALYQFNEALRYRRDAIPPRIGVARALIGLHREEEAERLLQSMLERDPANDEARALLESMQSQTQR